MLPPIFPRPTSPISMRVLPTWVSGQEATRHQQVAEVGVCLSVEGVHSREYDGLGGGRERQLHERRLERAKPVEQELRVEPGGEVVTVHGGLDRLAGHRLL